MSRRKALRLIGGATLSAAAGAPRAALEPGTLLVEAMHSRKISSTGEALPVIGLGTWQTFDVGPSAAERAPLKEVLRNFASMGGKVVDSSPMYGSSEEVAGDLMAELGLQSKLFVATKVWTSGKSAGIEQMEDSMRKLRAPRLDLMQVHNLVDVETHLDTLQQWKHERRIRYVGITHYTAGAYDAVARVMKSRPLDFLQINYSVAEREAERQLLPLAQERGVAVIANRPFGGGSVFGQLRGRPIPAWSADIDCKSWAQLLLKFVVSHPAITCAIPATSKVTHLRDNMGAGYGRLPDEALRARIAAAING